LTRRVKRRKLADEEDKASNDHGAIHAAIRSAKKASRPSKIGAQEKSSASASKKAHKRKVVGDHQDRFNDELGHKIGSREGLRAKKGDKVGKGIKKRYKR
jgi:ATP-dependent RNA helicase DDX27